MIVGRAGSAWAIRRQPQLQRRFLARGPAPEQPGNSRSAVNLFWARNAILHGLHAACLAQGATVLLPAFICKSIPQAVAALGGLPEFYRVGENCDIDLCDIERRIRPGVGAVLAVHYFGVFQPGMHQLRTLCDRNGLVLIEDCAHVLPAQCAPGSIGAIGHISVFSWRKFLPVFDGATLSIEASAARQTFRATTRNWMLEFRSAKEMLNRWRGSDDRNLQPAPELQEGLKRQSAARLPPAQGNAPTRPGAPGTTTDADSDCYCATFVDVPMTMASEWIRNRSDLASIVVARRSNWQELHNAATQSRVMQPLHDRLAEGAGPWAYALRFRGMRDAHKALRRIGIPAATWSGVRPESLPRDLHVEAERLYQDLVFLPVHQDLGAAELGLMTDAMRQVAQ